MKFKKMLKQNGKKIVLCFLLLEAVLVALIVSGLWFVPGIPVIFVLLFVAAFLVWMIFRRKKEKKYVYDGPGASNDIPDLHVNDVPKRCLNDIDLRVSDETGMLHISGRDGVLYIGGTGSMRQLRKKGIPWRSCLDEITGIVIEDGVTDICNGAFFNCKNVREVCIPKSVVRIEASAFENCSALIHLEIPPQLTNIGPAAFLGCKSLADSEGFIIVNGILFEYIGDAETVRIPDTVTVIGEWAFGTRFERPLQTVVIPGSVSEIKRAPFQSCGKLAMLYFEGDAPKIVDDPESFHDVLGENLLGVPCDTGQHVTICYYADAKGWTESYKQMILSQRIRHLDAGIHLRELQR